MWKLDIGYHFCYVKVDIGYYSVMWKLDIEYNFVILLNLDYVCINMFKSIQIIEVISLCSVFVCETHCQKMWTMS